jgi:ComF family protein
MDYNAQAVQDAIRTLKYDGTKSAARLLAAGLADYLREEIANMKTFSPRTILLVPVPLHTSRVRERGFNQMERVLHELPDEFKDGSMSRIAFNSLARVRATPQQTRLSRTERLKNVSGAFAADGVAVRGAHIVIIDDVTTTGATLSECVRALESAGAQVTAIALSRA